MKEPTAMTITVPKTLAGSRRRLETLELTTRLAGWERAAIVWAHTNGDRNKSRLVAPSGVTNIPDIAEALGLSPRTIDRARQAWKVAMEQHGAPDIKPGEPIPAAILELDYPPTEPTEDRYERNAEAAFRASPELAERLVVEALADERTAPAVYDAVASDLKHVSAVHARVVQRNTDYVERHAPTPRTDYDRAVVAAVDTVLRSLQAERQGEWEPSGSTSLLLHFLGRLLNEHAEPAGVSAELFNEIDDFLAKAGAR